MKDININYIFDAFEKDSVGRFQDFMKVRSFASKIVSLTFPSFSDYSPNTVKNNFMVFSDDYDPQFLKILCEGNTQDLGLVPGYYFVTKIKLPKDFPVENNEFGYIIFSIFTQENMDLSETEFFVTQLGYKLYYREYPFTKNLLLEDSPIFSFILITSPSQNARGAIGYTNIGGDSLKNLKGGPSNIIRNVVVNLYGGSHKEEDLTLIFE